MRGSARVKPPHGHSPGPVSTRPNSKPPTPRHRPHKPSPSNLQGVPCAAVHGFNLPTVTRPAQSAPAPGQNPQAPVTHNTSWFPARTRTRALPRTARLKTIQIHLCALRVFAVNIVILVHINPKPHHSQARHPRPRPGIHTENTPIQSQPTRPPNLAPATEKPKGRCHSHAPSTSRCRLTKTYNPRT